MLSCIHGAALQSIGEQDASGGTSEHRNISTGRKQWTQLAAHAGIRHCSQADEGRLANSHCVGESISEPLEAHNVVTTCSRSTKVCYGWTRCSVPQPQDTSHCRCCCYCRHSRADGLHTRRTSSRASPTDTAPTRVLPECMGSRAPQTHRKHMLDKRTSKVTSRRCNQPQRTAAHSYGLPLPTAL